MSVNSRYRLSQDPFGSQSQMLRLVGRQKRVLEFGCATGYMSELMVGGGCEVVGIEVDPTAAHVASAFCGNVIVADLNTLDDIPYPDYSFDVMLFGDVLEHLINPELVLARFRDYLKPGGRAIVSVPNIANWVIRWELVRGRWNYTETGPMDRTHLRFYTRNTAAQMLVSAGYDVVDELFSPGLYHIPFYRHTIHRLLAKLGKHEEVNNRLTRLWPELFAYQIILVGCPTARHHQA